MKVQAQELRIGNLLYQKDDDVIHHVLKLEEGKTWCNIPHCKHSVSTEKGLYLNNFKPIPLTEEWLLKFGFEKTERNYFEIFDMLIDLDSRNFHLSVGNHPNSFEYELKRPDYVHQLQNLYFALTGKELEIK